MSDKLSEFNVIGKNDAIDSEIQETREMTSTSLRNGSVDHRTAVVSGGLLSDEPNDSTSQTYSEEWMKFEKLLQSLHTSVARLENFAKSEKIEKIDMSTIADEDQNENLKNIDEHITTSDQQKEMMLLKAELSAKDEKIKTLEAMLIECHNNGIATATEVPPIEKKIEVTEIIEEKVIRLEAQLSAKREQIATLRTFFKAEKIRVEAAFKVLKSSYEDEKTIVNETILKLRNELRMLKESAEKFSSRANEWKLQLVAAEQERETLNLLVRLAVQQKLSLTLKLEEKEAKIHEARCRNRQ